MALFRRVSITPAVSATIPRSTSASDRLRHASLHVALVPAPHFERVTMSDDAPQPRPRLDILDRAGRSPLAAASPRRASPMPSPSTPGHRLSPRPSGLVSGAGHRCDARGRPGHGRAAPQHGGDRQTSGGPRHPRRPSAHSRRSGFVRASPRAPAGASVSSRRRSPARKALPS